MPRKHTEETKEKISASVKKSIDEKRIKSDPLKTRLNKLAEKFKSGSSKTPLPSVVRSSGSVKRTSGTVSDWIEQNEKEYQQSSVVINPIIHEE